MAGSKASGPDPGQLLQEAEDALWACEILLPEPVPGRLYEKADAAVDAAVGDLERHTAKRLEDRLHAIPEPSLAVRGDH